VRFFLDQNAMATARTASFAVMCAIAGSLGHAKAATELNCFPARTLVGNNNPSPANRVVKTYVRHSEAGWLVYHTLASQGIIDRSSQYSINDSSTPSSTEQWTGRFNRDPSLVMVGEVRTDPRTGLYYYIEAIYDQSRAGTLIVKTVAECSPIGNVAPGRTFQAAVPQMAVPQRSTNLEPPLHSSSEAIVPMVSDGGTFAVPVTINNQLTLKFVVDSGASDVSVPTDVVSTLVRTGTIADSDFLGSQTYKLADGSTVPSQRFQIRSLKVGNRILENVTASIAPIAGQLLLGQSFLRRFKSWSIDNGRSALILNGDAIPEDSSQRAEPSLSGLIASPGSQ
jgi:clan AA aspartic protease (TIGR02281 family)